MLRRAFGDKVIEDTLISCIAKAVGDAVAQNNKMLLSSSWVLQEKEVTRL